MDRQRLAKKAEREREQAKERAMLEQGGFFGRPAAAPVATRGDRGRNDRAGALSQAAPSVPPGPVSDHHRGAGWADPAALGRGDRERDDGRHGRASEPSPLGHLSDRRHRGNDRDVEPGGPWSPSHAAESAADASRRKKEVRGIHRPR